MKITLFFLFISNLFAFDRCLLNVKAQFDNLSATGRDIPIKVKKGVFEKLSYTFRPLNKMGIDNHFQGIQRLPGENNFILTGSNLNTKSGDLIIINNGEIVKRETLGAWPYWHPGGFQTLQNFVAIPVEEYKKSEVAKILFFDFHDLTSPKKLPVLINIPNTKSGAVFFHQFPDGKYLIGSYNMTKIDLYFSNTSNLLDGFEEKPKFSFDRRKFDLGLMKPFDFGAQSVNIIPQCDGKLFFVFFQNTGKAPPLINKDDRALLFNLDLNTKGNPVTLVSMKKLVCKKNCNFSAAAGIYINEEGKLFVYSAPHYLKFKQNHYTIREFKEQKIP